MTQQPKLDADSLHKEYPKRFAKDEFWQQIKRTVNGKPVSENDITMIVEQVTCLLDLQPSDHLLDLGCGNGALASRLFESIDQYTGVDFSEYLLEVANEFFAPHSRIRYLAADIRDVEKYLAVANLQHPESVNKVLIYGCIAYLSKLDTKKLLQQLKLKLPRATRILIGNIPIREKAEEFYSARSITDYDLDDPTSMIGVWWSTNELVQLATELGFSATCHFMPTEFYGSQYRFDLLIESR